VRVSRWTQTRSSATVADRGAPKVLRLVAASLVIVSVIGIRVVSVDTHARVLRVATNGPRTCVHVGQVRVLGHKEGPNAGACLPTPRIATPGGLVHGLEGGHR
jgi:hypothetical protein